MLPPSLPSWYSLLLLPHCYWLFCLVLHSHSPSESRTLFLPHPSQSRVSSLCPPSALAMASLHRTIKNPGYTADLLISPARPSTVSHSQQTYGKLSECITYWMENTARSLCADRFFCLQFPPPQPLEEWPLQTVKLDTKTTCNAWLASKAGSYRWDYTE